VVLPRIDRSTTVRKLITSSWFRRRTDSRLIGAKLLRRGPTGQGIDVSRGDRNGIRGDGRKLLSITILLICTYNRIVYREKRTLTDAIRERRWNMFGHAPRLPEEKHDITLEGMTEGKKTAGRPRSSYLGHETIVMQECQNL